MEGSKLKDRIASDNNSPLGEEESHGDDIKWKQRKLAGMTGRTGEGTEFIIQLLLKDL